MYKVGIIGNGFVGSAIASGFALHADVFVYDIDPKKTIDSFEEVMECQFIFICVPTPMNLNNNNKIDLSMVKKALQKAAKYSKGENIFILKSTVIPGTTQALTKQFPDLEIVFNPEFLTERSARLDFINASRIILGGSNPACSRVSDLYRARFPHTHIITTDATTAEFIKYMCNCFFATKISYMNEMKQASNKLNLDWNGIIQGFLSDGRIGNSHTDVPGHDGHPGFGGKCFPKDINAFINFFKDIKIDPTILSATWQKNMEVREEADWEKIQGAISKGETMEELSAELKNNTIAIDFDGVIHQYSKRWQGMDNVYDPPMPGSVESIKKLKNAGYRLIIFSSRSTPVIEEWLKKYDLDSYFDEVTNTKIPAKVYIDDKAYHFENWEKTMGDLFD